MKLSRIRRAVTLIGLLQGGKGSNADALATACRVSRRTIFRDLDLLRQSGIPLEYDEELQRYRISGRCSLPPTDFTAEEALALIVLCHEMGQSGGLPFFAPARSAALKIESNLPIRLREQLRNVAAAVEIHPAPPIPWRSRNRSTSSCSGRSPRGAACGSVTRAWRNARTICDAAESLSPLVQPAELVRDRPVVAAPRRPDVQPGEDFGDRAAQGRLPDSPILSRLSATCGNAWHLIPEPGPDRDVWIHFQPLVAQNVAEVRWHSTQQTQFREDGSLDYRVTVSGLDEISWWILGYGEQAEVIEPAELRHLVGNRAARMAAIYRRAGQPATDGDGTARASTFSFPAASAPPFA